MDSVSKVSALLDTTRDLTLDASAAGLARTVNARQSHRELPYTTVKGMLESKHEQEVLDALKHVIFIMYRQQDSQPYFTAVVKLVAHANLSIRKLVYLYLVQHAESEPDTALLAVNSLQKGLSDAQASNRALALRTMAALRVPIISQVILLAVQRGCGDPSPLVRKVAALSIPKCFRLDPTSQPQLEELLSILLQDSQYFVVGPAVVAFSVVCPDRIDLLHQAYRNIIKKLVDMDEWSQIVVLRVLLRYCLLCFPVADNTTSSPETPTTEPQEDTKVESPTREPQENTKDEVSTTDPEKDESAESPTMDHQQKKKDDPATSDNTSPHGKTQGKETLELSSAEPEYVDRGVMQLFDTNPDLEAFLRACRNLLHSRTAAVILAAAEILLRFGLEDDFAQAAGSLVGLLRCSSSIQELVLQNIVICNRPRTFARFYARFLLHSQDPVPVACLKLEVQSLIYPFCQPLHRQLLLTELEHFTHSDQPDIRKSSVYGLGLCGQTDVESSSFVLNLLMQNVVHPDEDLVGQSVDAIRLLILQDPSDHVHLVMLLAQNLDRITSPMARAAVIWLVSKNAHLPPDQNLAPDVLAILAPSFAKEPEAARLVILVLAAHVFLELLREEKTNQAVSKGKPKSEEPDRSPVGLSRKSKSSDLESANSQTSEIPNPRPESSAEYVRDGDSQRLEEAISAEHVRDDDDPIPGDKKPEDKTSSDRVAQMQLVWHYLLAMALKDESDAVKDRARIYTEFFVDTASFEAAEDCLMEPGVPPVIPRPSDEKYHWRIGSSALMADYETPEYEELPLRVKPGQQPKAEVRDPIVAQPVISHPVEEYEESAYEPRDVHADERVTADFEDQAAKALDDWLNGASDE